MQERRKFERRSSSIRVEISHPSFGFLIGSTTDISDGGARVLMESSVVPPEGTDVKVRFKKIVAQVNDKPVAMRVMHVHKNTLGLMFLPR
ncbi:PilZ domain-containing protein [Agaribacterium haliotis]|uniref:PilZ domain-containing protein n=1 Tax=Agaribacterium haliotis TaxID=2013869 RepID=UPI000BB57475|nr:PilZ domain-containing protein [Agaribacterium haliotis]